MKNKIVCVPTPKTLVKRTPGFEKKQLADYKLDLCGLCGFGCRYCSSNNGNYLRINRKDFLNRTGKVLGFPSLPADDPSLTFEWNNAIPRLQKELEAHRKTWGKGKTLVFSMLTDGFSPNLVARGETRQALDLLLKHTSFRIRVLTKNAVVGDDNWVSFFQEHKRRFVVGLSIGSLDASWARQVELGTSSPSDRIEALHKLQDAGVRTYGMLCPVFPDALQDDSLEDLIDAIRPLRTQHVWAEPYNDRGNWRKVRSGYQPGSFGHDWMTNVFEGDGKADWSKYSRDLYERIRDKADAEGWTNRIRYLLYTKDLTTSDKSWLKRRAGVLVQG